jgi:hypothetical protein
LSRLGIRIGWLGSSSASPQYYMPGVSLHSTTLKSKFDKAVVFYAHVLIACSVNPARGIAKSLNGTGTQSRSSCYGASSMRPLSLSLKTDDASILEGKKQFATGSDHPIEHRR